METKWYKVSDNQLTDEEIHNLTMEIKQRKSQLLSLYLATSPLPSPNRAYAPGKAYSRKEL